MTKAGMHCSKTQVILGVFLSALSLQPSLMFGGLNWRFSWETKQKKAANVYNSSAE